MSSSSASPTRCCLSAPFKRIVPELANGSRTLAGVPVRGSCWLRPHLSGRQRGETGGLGLAGVDLNFGCPAKVVNRHGRGAQLQDPDHIGRVDLKPCRAVPAHAPVSAKMRLGFHDDSLAEACAQAIEGPQALSESHPCPHQGAWLSPASLLGSHCRHSPACACPSLPMVRFGRSPTCCAARSRAARHWMIGRGAVSDPGWRWPFARANKPHQADREPILLHPAVPWSGPRSSVSCFWELICDHVIAQAPSGAHEAMAELSAQNLSVSRGNLPKRAHAQRFRQMEDWK